MKSKILGWLIVLCCFGCSPGASHKKYHALSDETWVRDSIINFKFDISSPGDYRMNIGVRHNTDYLYADLRCFLSVMHNDRLVRMDTINLTLSDITGKGLGSGMSGLKTITLPVNKVFSLDSIGTYNFYLWHGMQEKKLKGIKNIGIELFAPLQ